MKTKNGYDQYCEEEECAKIAVHEHDGRMLCDANYLLYVKEEGMLLDQD